VKQQVWLDFSLPLVDPASGYPVEVRFWGHADAGRAGSVLGAVQSVLSARLARHELAIRVLPLCLPHLLPEIAAHARVSTLVLQAWVAEDTITTVTIQPAEGKAG
jgi:hypothetical protein